MAAYPFTRPPRARFCHWPDGLDPRNAGPPGQKQPVGTLMLRAVGDGVSGALGPLFWIGDIVPAGFGPASAAAGVVTLNATDATTQRDVGVLKGGGVPCEAGGGSLKCPACAGGCQLYDEQPRGYHLANERAHWLLPGGGDGALLVHDVLDGGVRYGLGANTAAVRFTALVGDRLVAAGDDGSAIVYDL